MITRAKLFAPRAAAALLTMALSLAALPASAQTLSDLVPVDELEIRSDDLMRLATSYADAVREYRTAEVSIKTIRSLGPSGQISGLELQIAQLNMQAAETKIQLLHAIGENLLQIAEAKANFIRRLERDGEDLPPPAPAAAEAAASPRLRQAEANIRIIQMILKLNPTKPAPSATGRS